MMRRFRLLAAAVVAVAGSVALGGCAQEPPPPLDPAFVAELAKPRFCYRTLAAVTCYDAPSTNQHDTLVGTSLPRVVTLPPPQPPALSGPVMLPPE
ncbi:hypothetical protein GCM10009099_24410 [Caenispirillum bisanense]